MDDEEVKEQQEEPQSCTICVQPIDATLDGLGGKEEQATTNEPLVIPPCGRCGYNGPVMTIWVPRLAQFWTKCPRCSALIVPLKYRDK